MHTHITCTRARTHMRTHMHTHTCTRTHSMQHTQLLCHNATHQPANGQARMHAHANIQKHALITFSLYRCCTRC